MKKKTKPPVIKLTGMHRESIRETKTEARQPYLSGHNYGHGEPAGHTPGPWEIIGRTSIYGDGAEDSRVKIAVVDTDRYSYQADDAEANARLIALAPDMLEQLKALMEYADDIKEVYGLGDTWKTIRGLIAKAEGGGS